jgi:radical SAM superfamily enzyme YgiQ (UPF0313 family)
MADPVYSRENFRSLIKFVRRLKLKYATFIVMTPLPGAELFSEREKDILSHKPELYDMLHALLPTTSPLEELYRVIPARYRFGMHGLI